jgi:hypothetical protein
MIEKTGLCPLCGTDFGSEDNVTVCTGCGIELRKHMPIVRLVRSWFWEFTSESITQLHKLWAEQQAKLKFAEGAGKDASVRCPRCGKNNLTIIYSQGAAYPLTLIDAKEDYCEVNWDEVDVVSSEIAHIDCDDCDAAWLDFADFGKEEEKRKK